MVKNFRNSFLVCTLLMTLILLSVSTPGAAHDYTVDGLKIDHPWARPTPGGTNLAAVYLSLVNNSNDADTLLSASSSIASKIEVHETTVTDGVAKMRRLEGGLPVAANSTVKLEPAGLHLMLMGLTRPLQLGERIPLTLNFQKRGAVEVKVNIEKAPDAPEKTEHHKHHH